MTNKELRLGNKLINRDSSPYLIAEIGVNHEGSILCFNEGEEMNWKPISREEFEYYVENTKNDEEQI